jgi:hypothetical protein
MSVVPGRVRLRSPLLLTCAFLVLVCGRASAQPPAVPQVGEVPPFPNRVNELMPGWLKVRGEFRERFEGIENAGFVEGRDDSYWLSRFRLNATITASPTLSFQVQGQDARVADKSVGPSGPPFTGPLDLRMAFADIGSAKGRLAARIGRQELFYGDQRLVGHVSWLNTARTFDGARLYFRSAPVQLEMFATSVVRIMEDELDKSGAGNRFFGAHAATTALIPQGSVEPYVFVRSDRTVRSEGGAVARLTATTIGTRLVGKLPSRFDYNVEMAVQAGAVAADSVRAWAGHWQLREALPFAFAVRLIGELNVASGDRDPADGTRGTFDQLYPTGHDKYGLADQVGWRNIRHARAGIELPPVKKFQITGSYHSWWLMERNDALYSASGAVIARVPGGAQSAHVGQELDVQASRPLTPYLQLATGYAHILPGGFLKEATPGASYSFPYVMVTYVFLADK